MVRFRLLSDEGHPPNETEDVVTNEGDVTSTSSALLPVASSRLTDDQKHLNYGLCGAALVLLLLVALLAKGMYEWNRRTQRRFEQVRTQQVGLPCTSVGSSGREAWNKKTMKKAPSDSRENLIESEVLPRAASVRPSLRPPGGTPMPRGRVANGDEKLQTGAHVSRDFHVSQMQPTLNVPVSTMETVFEEMPDNAKKKYENVKKEHVPLQSINGAMDSKAIVANIDDFLLRLESQLEVIKTTELSRTVSDVSCAPSSIVEIRMPLSPDLPAHSHASMHTIGTNSCGRSTAITLVDPSSSSTRVSADLSHPPEPSSLCTIYPSPDEGIVLSPTSVALRDMKLQNGYPTHSGSGSASTQTTGVGSATSCEIITEVEETAFDGSGSFGNSVPRPDSKERSLRESVE